MATWWSHAGHAADEPGALSSSEAGISAARDHAAAALQLSGPQIEHRHADLPCKGSVDPAPVRIGSAGRLDLCMAFIKPVCPGPHAAATLPAV